VRKGERGIRILAPIWVRDAADSRTGDTAAASSALAELTEPQRRLAFRPTSVFDVSQTEGQITRLKALKRQMFGRAGFGLLKRRLLRAA